MPDELSDVLDTAIYKEVASQAMYEAAQRKTDDPAAMKLLKDLSRQEIKHAEKLKDLRQKGLVEDWHPREIADLKISDYMTGGDTLEGAGLQDTLVFAMKREEESVDFYRKLTGIMRDEAARKLCTSLVKEEMKHKKHLETLYDELFYGEN
jgi:rubrerythrin